MIDDINILLASMTLEEKASLCSGEDFWHLKSIERLNIPSIMVADGPHGLRKQPQEGDHVGLGESIKSTCFPTASATASSWDPELLFKIGEALGEECIQEDVSVILGPGANIKRSPLCGRNFEYISEDPYLTGKIGSALVKGVQSKGIGTSLKHFAFNNQEYRRMVTESVVDERTQREIYLPGFEEIVKTAQPWTVMCAYNMVDGFYCSDNKKLLTDILKEEWGHTGLVVTDWGACNDRVLGVKAGLELEMPSSGGINDKLIVEAVNNGTLDEKYLDKVVIRILELIQKSINTPKGKKFNTEEHNKLAREAASNSAVLLKNLNNTLPILKNSVPLVIGEFADKPRYQGAGSSLINPIKVTSFLDELNNQKIEHNYCKGYSIDTDEPKEDLIKEAVQKAKESSVVIIFAGLTDDYESEGFDRTHLGLPKSHTKLIKAISAVHKNIIVVLQNGAPVIMPWIDGVNGVLESYLGGQAGGAAIADIIFGDVNPSGKLAETFPLDLRDDLASEWFGMGPNSVEYRESVYVGYRYYDSAKKDVLFPFGHGLSYTSFEYSDIILGQQSITDNEEVDVTVTIKNIGKIPGAEIVQLYVKDNITTLFRPEKELKGFKKVYLEPNESKTITFTLNKRSFAYYNIDIKDWHVESGVFSILVGSSSRDIRLKSEINVASTKPDVIVPDLRELTPEYYNISSGNISDRTFETILCRPIPKRFRKKGEKFTINSTLGDVKKTFIGKKMYNSAYKAFLPPATDSVVIDPRMERMMKAMIEDLPIRSAMLFSGGKLSRTKVAGLIAFMNKNIFKGIYNILK